MKNQCSFALSTNHRGELIGWLTADEIATIESSNKGSKGLLKTCINVILISNHESANWQLINGKLIH